jgi:CHAD domain-containing protein
MKPLCFVLDGTADLPTPETLLSDEWRCEKINNAEHFQRIYLDSLDWRLLKNDLSLFADMRGDKVHLFLFDLRDNKLIANAPSRLVPAFSGDLTEEELAATAAPILQQRALLPHIQIAVTRYPMAVIDNTGATMARLDLELSKPNSKEGAKSMTQDRRLWFTPIRGYEKQNRTIISTLSTFGSPMASAVIPVRNLITWLGIDTSRFDTRPVIQLQGADRSDGTLKRLLRFCLSVMEANRPGVISDIDADCLHDFRVAMRRSRSLLGQARGVINDERLERAKSFFARLSEITNHHRDLDVLLSKFGSYTSSLPVHAQRHLDPVYTNIMGQRGHAVEKTIRFLQSANYHRFVASWQKYLDTAVSSRTTLPKAAKPIKSLADARIWKAYKRVITQGSAIDGDSPPGQLHDMRKDCKTLRYLIEFFSSLYPAKKLKRALSVLKRLQDNLGEFQDYHIHIALLDETRLALIASKLVERPADEATMNIIMALAKHQAVCRKRFHKCFLDFSNEAHQRLFKSLFRN